MSARESADDAKDGGELVTTLLLGFPQGVVTALFIVARLAWKYLPGPEIVKKNPEVIYSVVWLQGISGIIGTLIGFGLAAKLAEVRYTFMVPIMFIFILMGAFSVNRGPIDLLVVVAFSVLGFFMRRFAYPRPAMILGLVLDDLMEKYLCRSVPGCGFSWLGRLAVIVLLIIAALSLALTVRSRLRASRKDSSASLSGRW